VSKVFGVNMTYSAMKEFDLDAGFAHLHNMLSQQPTYLGSEILPTIDGISVTHLLGKGATSRVYEGLWSGEKVAVKFVAEDFQDEAEREVKILKNLGNHDRGVPEIAVDINLPPRILVLSPILSPVGENFRVNDVDDLLDALNYIHDKGFFHRDIRPANIMRTASRIFLVDFGNAIAMNEGRRCQICRDRVHGFRRCTGGHDY